MRLGKCLIAAAIVSLGTGCGGSSSGGSNSQPAAVTNATTTPSAPTSSGFKLGVNLDTIAYWDGSRPFVNLLYGGSWQMVGTGAAEDVPSQDLDANGWVKSVPAGYQVQRPVSVPGATGDFVCKFQGSGAINVGGPVSNVSTAAGVTKFTVTATYPNEQLIYLKYAVDAADYIRNIDCREAAASTSTIFAPEFLSTLGGFKTIRFIKWTPSVEANTPNITWASRNKPGDGDYQHNDGVPVELMVELANEAGANPWFNVPWNADDDYVTRFATYVRDHLSADKQVYVETSNEVWNGSYPVFAQAASEATAEKLDPTAAQFQQVAERYAEKTQHVMQIWSNVFAGQTNRLVRVAAFQNVSPFYGELMLKYQDTYKSVDAFATAPYWAFMPGDYSGQTVDQIMGTVLPAKIDETLGFAVQNKELAAKYGLRYVTYEGGQHVVLPSNVDLLKQIERDPRMADLYTSYVNKWQQQIGDPLTLFALTGPISASGAWGLVEYNGQPLSDAPKMRAVHAFLN
jgi:hypothetical protein